METKDRAVCHPYMEGGTKTNGLSNTDNRFREEEPETGNEEKSHTKQEFSHYLQAIHKRIPGVPKHYFK